MSNRQRPNYDTELVRAISNLVCVLEEGRITFINPAGAEMLNVDSVKDVLGRDFADFVHADYADLIALGIEAFTEEESGVPLKLRPIHAMPIDVLMHVRELTEECQLETQAFMVECRDISNYIKASEDARKREQRLANVLGTVQDAIITIDPKGKIQSINAAGEKMFGYTKIELLGHNVKTLMPKEIATEHDSYIDNYVTTGEGQVMNSSMESEGQQADGTLFPIEISVTQMTEGSQRLFTGVIRDITQRKKALQKIEHLAHHDSLTGLPNRNLYMERVERAVVRARRSGKPLALLFVDLDKFKPINDNLGHEAGDIVLKTVAERMLQCVRQSDTVARIGGDEFVAVLENLDAAESAGVVAKKIINILVEDVDVGNGQLANVGASIGISIFPGDGDSTDELARAADEAMYAVKEAGRNNFKFYKDVKDKPS
ncbi:MAG: diguanylate cyclase [Magnetovibrio sp.]|nr:diguanylate cyclase [Magnetovibrio sp.]